MIRNSVRLGLFRDRPVFDEARPSYDSIVVPAHLAAHSPDGLWGFLKGIESPSFFYDPMTYWFVLDPKHWTRGSEEGRGLDAVMPLRADDIRPAFRRLIEEYGLLDAVTSMGAAEFAAAIPDLLPRAVIDFQRRGINAKTDRAARKYALILRKPLDGMGFRPSRFVAPYVAMDPSDYRSVETQARLNDGALNQRQPADELWAVVAFSGAQAMRPIDDMGAFLRLDQFPGVGLWVGGLDEHSAPVRSLVLYRHIIRSIRAPVWLMYAGYFGVLASFDGVQEISHGVFYTESKQLVGPVGSGPPADRYYIPRLHRFYEPARALAIIRAIPEFACLCPDCQPFEALMDSAMSVRAGSPMRAEWVARLQRHFLRSRAAEVEAVSGMVRTEAIQDLRLSADRISQLPPQIQRGLGVQDRHLLRWAEALDYQE
jgi:hypothetical protein